MTERWLPVVEWEGLYEVSDLGRVRSLERFVMSTRSGTPYRRHVPARILVAAVHQKTGKLRVTLSRNGITERRPVHHLVLEAFVGPRPSGLYPDSGMIVLSEESLSYNVNPLALQHISGDTDAMSNDLIEGLTWFVERPCPNSDLVVSNVVTEDGSAQWVRISGLDLPADYLTGVEAEALAGALLAAAELRGAHRRDVRRAPPRESN